MSMMHSMSLRHAGRTRLLGAGLRGAGTLLMAAAIASAAPMNAHAYSAKVQTACKSDFKKFCPAYKVGSSELRACMRSVGGGLSRRCIDALADSGVINKKYHSKN